MAFPEDAGVGHLPWAQGSLTVQDPCLSHAPHLGFFSVFLCCLRDASKDYFGNS